MTDQDGASSGTGGYSSKAIEDDKARRAAEKNQKTKDANKKREADDKEQKTK
jgi:hypothetical protein